MHDVVPRGFPAYVRIFHPAYRDRPVGTTWPPLPVQRHRQAWRAFEQSGPQIETQTATWTQTAAAMGTAVHPLVQWTALVAPGHTDATHGTFGHDGWRYHRPPEGDLDAPTLSRTAAHLSSYTSTPTDGFVAVWDGWGGLLGFEADTPARLLLQSGTEVDPQHTAMLSRSLPEQFRGIFARKHWWRGALSDQISHGPRLALPGRHHVLFSGGIDTFLDPDWIRAMPWHHHDDPAPLEHSPSLIWPSDRTWVVVTDIDADSTIIAGPAALIQAITTDPELDSAAITAGAAPYTCADGDST